uniref:Luteinizing hormone subunit beta n=1 Tax=Erpetoichthys calabaricus TaxID=27687 RepID=A0A8C4TK38_ERPCA
MYTSQEIMIKLYNVITLFFFIHTCAYASILRHCEPVNETISVEKEECPKCVLITTRICSGYCLTRDFLFKSTIAPLYQHVCSYKEIRYEKIKLPGCPNGVDPYFTYPVAVSCYCSLCKMDNSDCTTQSISPSFCIYGKTHLYLI